ncbi:hypothetical protein [Absidia glauca]|uniref:Uncharacterized protein n=1 Tax=Absidia glauca TaxID=4829 RepID=A0A168KRP2_ABSGL|nr:hypothetical protein [Absidia glauca]
MPDPSDIPTLGVPEFPARDGPQRLAAAATPQSKRRQKVKLEPGHSPLDWARLKTSGQDLRVRASRNWQGIPSRNLNNTDPSTMHGLRFKAKYTTLHPT